jgi:hypothetical protein
MVLVEEERSVPTLGRYCVAVTVEELWVETYQGEVYGEAIFGLMADRETDPVRRRQLEVMALLERRTRELAEDVMDRRGLDRGDVGAAAQETAEAVAAKSWEELLDWIERVTAHYLVSYRELVESAADQAERAVAEAYVAHEEALAAFGRRASGQESGEPLEPILTLPHMAGISAVN